MGEAFISRRGGTSDIPTTKFQGTALTQIDKGGAVVAMERMEWGGGLANGTPFAPPNSTGNGASWSPDGRYLATAHQSSPYVTIYDWSSGVPVKISHVAPSSLPGLAARLGCVVGWVSDSCR